MCLRGVSFRCIRILVVGVAVCGLIMMGGTVLVIGVCFGHFVDTPRDRTTRTAEIHTKPRVFSRRLPATTSHIP